MTDLPDMPKPVSIDICLCTFQRLHLLDTLTSLNQLVIEPEWLIRIIVADNDDTRSAEPVIKTFQASCRFPILYIHAPARNISVARNACLDEARADFIAFIDDDEIATAAWLTSLMSIRFATQSDIVLGPVQAIYPPQSPSWMRAGDFHSTKPVFVGGSIRTGYTCNVLLRRAVCEEPRLRFRVELGRTGGEDTIFFSALSEAGLTISFSEAAVVLENISENRLNLKWLMLRSFRSGQTHGRLLLMRSKKLPGKVSALVIAFLKLTYCYLICLLCLANSVAWRRWFLRGTLHLGVLARLAGQKELTQYG
jgi:succinoglycan biosynthesis protein ExoM